jgi:aspartate aminotransferase
MPSISKLVSSREPSPVRMAGILLRERTDNVDAINLAIGNVRLPMHPIMQERLTNLGSQEPNLNPFSSGVISYPPTTGTAEARNAFKKFIAAGNSRDTDSLNVLITNGGSQAMELALLAAGGSAGSVLLFEPTYSNYLAFGERLDVDINGIETRIDASGSYQLPSDTEIIEAIEITKANAILIIPYNNPTGKYYSQSEIDRIARIASDKDIWLISDEAYRGLQFNNKKVSSIWNINLNQNPKIKGKRMSIESASKVWNGCGLRIGAIVTDNNMVHKQLVSEFTSNLGASALGQYIFAGINELKIEEIQEWFEKQRSHYKSIAKLVKNELLRELPNLKVSEPESALYKIIDVKDYVDETFDSEDFIEFCARHGKIRIDQIFYTLLLAPLSGFYSDNSGQKTKMRLAFVEPESRIKHVGILLKELLSQYSAKT